MDDEQDQPDAPPPNIMAQLAAAETPWQRSGKGIMDGAIVISRQSTPLQFPQATVSPIANSDPSPPVDTPVLPASGGDAFGSGGSGLPTLPTTAGTQWLLMYDVDTTTLSWVSFDAPTIPYALPGGATDKQGEIPVFNQRAYP